VTGRTALPVSD